MPRIFSALIVCQALIDTAPAEEVPTGEIYRTFRRSRPVVVPGIMNGSAFSWVVSSDLTLAQGVTAGRRGEPGFLNGGKSACGIRRELV